MSKTFVYEHGFPFTKSLADDVIIPIATMKRGIGLILIGGRPSTGKTTLAVEIADFIEGRPISLDKNDHPQLNLGHKNLIDNALICYRRKYKIIIYDEAGDFSKKSTLTKANRTIQQFFEKCRSLGLLMILVCPNPLEIDNGLFKIPGLIQGLIFIEKSSENDSHFGVYDADGIGWLKYYNTKWPFHPHMPYKMSRPYMRGHFLNLPPGREEKLRSISTDDKVLSMINLSEEMTRKPVKVVRKKKVGKKKKIKGG